MILQLIFNWMCFASSEISFVVNETFLQAKFSLGFFLTYVIFNSNWKQTSFNRYRGRYYSKNLFANFEWNHKNRFNIEYIGYFDSRYSLFSVNNERKKNYGNFRNNNVIVAKDNLNLI